MKQMPVVYLVHGGGPLPLLGDPGHQGLVKFLQEIPAMLEQPKAILMISAHWEQPVPTLTSSAHPALIYDYGGFPPESYEIEYPAPGQPELARQAQRILQEQGIETALDETRGFDHGMFVPLKLMYPKADIPCVQLSLLESLDAAEHIALGHALAPLRDQGVLITGSGSSFHNMRAMLEGGQRGQVESIAFNDWLIETCSGQGLDSAIREYRLAHWEEAPHGRYCHPREEHLLPLHVCFGAAGGTAAVPVFNELLFGKAMSGYLWKE